VLEDHAHGTMRCVGADQRPLHLIRGHLDGPPLDSERVKGH
jgi:hypothetical protein